MHDLNDLIPETETITVELTHKGKVLTNKDGSSMTIEVYLPHSKEYRKAKHKQADQLLLDKEKKYTSADYEKIGIDFLAETTVSWNITLGGSCPKLTKKKAIEVYEQFPSIGEQVQAKVNELEDFT